MGSNCLADDWLQLNGPMQARWAKLTNNTLVVAAGRRERLVELLLEHYGFGRARAERELDEFTRTRWADLQAKVEECSPLLVH